MSRITQKDIAKKVGVSISTVSRALSRPEMVKETTRDKILRVINEMGYKPKIRKKGLVSRKTTVVKSRSKTKGRIKLSDIAKATGVSVSTVSRTLNRPEMVKESTRNKVLKVIKKMGYKPKVKEKGLVSRKTNVEEKYLEYKNYMANKPNDTVLTRWGMYTSDKRYRDYTASIVNMIRKDMNINNDQAYYMLYYMVSNDIDDYERAKRDMKVDPNFEMYRTKRK